MASFTSCAEVKNAQSSPLSLLRRHFFKETDEWEEATEEFFSYLMILFYYTDRLCGLVVRVPGYRSRGPGFDSRWYQIF
jgi:hypothetical protein